MLSCGRLRGIWASRRLPCLQHIWNAANRRVPILYDRFTTHVDLAFGSTCDYNSHRYMMSGRTGEGQHLKQTVEIRDVLQCALQSSLQASQIVERVFASGNLGAIEKHIVKEGSSEEKQQKSYIDPQTLADTLAENRIIQTWKAGIPGVCLVGEESGNIQDSPDVLDIASSEGDDGAEWNIDTPINVLNDNYSRLHPNPLDLDDIVVWIDPLDGTKAYVLGEVEAATVLVGISYRGKPLVGVVSMPFTHTLYWGVMGLGAYQLKWDQSNTIYDHTRIIPHSSSSSSSRHVITSRHYLTSSLLERIQGIHPSKVTSEGGGGRKGVMILNGQADAWLYPQVGTKRWDTCALEALLKSVGGNLTDVFGNSLEYEKNPEEDYLNHNGVLATMTNHDTYILNSQDIHIREPDHTEFLEPPPLQ